MANLHRCLYAYQTGKRRLDVQNCEVSQLLTTHEANHKISELSVFQPIACGRKDKKKYFFS